MSHPLTDINDTVVVGAVGIVTLTVAFRAMKLSVHVDTSQKLRFRLCLYKSDIK
jgi:hypothetical protein